MSKHRYYKTHNVKFHFKLSDQRWAEDQVHHHQQLDDDVRRRKNFCVKRINGLVFTIFSSGHVNATGIKSFDNVTLAIREFYTHFNLQLTERQPFVIDNSTSIASFFPLREGGGGDGGGGGGGRRRGGEERRINISALSAPIIKAAAASVNSGNKGSRCRGDNGGPTGVEDKITLSLRPYFFPGAVIRRENKCSIVLFATGKFIIIGAKSRAEIDHAYDTICATITRLIC